MREQRFECRIKKILESKGILRAQSWLIQLHDLTKRKESEDLMKSHGYNLGGLIIITCMLGKLGSKSWEP